MELMGIQENFYRKFSAAEYQRRHALLRGAMTGKGIDVTIVYGARSVAV